LAISTVEADTVELGGSGVEFVSVLDGPDDEASVDEVDESTVASLVDDSVLVESSADAGAAHTKAWPVAIAAPKPTVTAPVPNHFEYVSLVRLVCRR
jgi:hypothetical protein